MRLSAIRRALIAVPAIVGAGILLADPASAATIKHGSDYGSVKHGSYDWMEACDMEKDGNGVYLEYWTSTGGHGTIWDGNGSKGGCGNFKLYNARVTSFRVCEDGAGCTPRVTP